MEIHVDFTIQKDCLNHDSYGEICVHCNCCGRYDKTTMYKSQIKILKDQLRECLNFNNWMPEFEEIQRENQNKNIEWYANKIKKAEEADTKLQNALKVSEQKE